MSSASNAESAAPGAQTSGLMARVIPCLDVAGDRVVKGVKFRGLRDAGDPVERARLYQSQGADELVLLDVAATPQARAHGAPVVERVRRELSIPLTVGGGIRAPEDAAVLLESGADKVAVNTAAVESPELLDRLAAKFGTQATVLAVDAARRVQDGGLPSNCSPGDWQVVTRSGKHATGIDALQWARDAVRRGVGEILLTSFDRDGTRSGYDLELLAAMRRAVDVPVIASGGADSPEHMAEALRAGAHAVLAASIFHEDGYTVQQVKARLADLGIRVRR